jgi:hypothetical protein
MEPLSLIDRFISWCFSSPVKRKFCKHHIVTHFTAEIFSVDGYERCGGVATCSKCPETFFVYVPANEVEREDAMQISG